MTGVARPIPQPTARYKAGRQALKRRSWVCPIWRANLTKMFHVKHFCPIGAKNLMRPKAAAPLRSCKIDRSFGAFLGGRRHRLDGTARCQNVAPVSVSLEATGRKRRTILHRHFAPRQA